MTPKDHYATLGVAQQAPPAEIKRAYRRLARQWHPDVSAAPDALARFQAVAAAHAALSDPLRRAQYDTTLAPSSSAFSSFFDSALARSRSTGAGKEGAKDEKTSFQPFDPRAPAPARR
jgi:DnaJ-class molecular chaperone